MFFQWIVIVAFLTILFNNDGVFAIDSQIQYSRSPENYGIGLRDDLVDWSKHPCKRECQNDGKPLICRYGLTIENYSTMSKACYDCPLNKNDCFRPHCVPADGNDKVIVVANRKLPGTTIEVCKGDRILVDITNGLVTSTTSIHWHGLHQRKTPFMDGVPYITQCPIMPGETFRYDFETDRAGTFVWHSHSGEQRTDGLFGALVVRSPPKDDLVKNLYDRDLHIIVLNEWMKMSGIESYIMQYQNGINANPHTILVNGLGKYYGPNSTDWHMPKAVFEVEQGLRYRFRVINVGSQNCALYVAVDDHPLTVISADGADIEPIEVDSIRLLTGERYDFVLTADRKIDNYWMRFKGDIACENKKTHQVAILRYKEAPEVEPTTEVKYEVGFRNDFRELNPFDQGTETPGARCISSLNSLEPDDDAITRDPDHQFYVGYDFYDLDTEDYHRKNLYGFEQIKQEHKQQRTLQLNHVTFAMPNFPLQTQPELIGSEQFCNVTENKCTREHCHCTNVLQAKLDSVVEIIIVDKGRFRMNHPMHLHGYYFRVVAMEKLNDTTTIEKVMEWDKAGKIHRKLEAAPKKDTVIVPSGGYTVVRIHANNPGYWFFHCHFEKHAGNGMALVLKVGEHKDFPEVPEDFPKCGHRKA